MPRRLAPLSVATPELFVVAAPAAAPFSVKVMFLPLNPELADVRVAVSVAVPPEDPEPLTALIAVEALLAVGTGLGLVVVVVAVVTSNASTHTQNPLDDPAFLPATSISRT